MKKKVGRLVKKGTFISTEFANWGSR